MTNSEQTGLVQDLMQLNAARPEDQSRLAECVIDFLAAVLVGTQTEIGRQITREYVSNGTTGFAFTLAYLAELSEYSHGHHWGAGHVGSGVLPVTLALAANTDCEDTDISNATIAGYEAVCRFGEAVMPELKREWGANATGFCGSIGASAVASRIYGLTTEQTSVALGTAAYLTPHNLHEGYVTGVHGFETGVAVAHGIMSVQLSTDFSTTSINGPTDILDDYHKRLKGKSPAHRFQSAKSNGLAIHELYFKPYPCCRATHAVIEAIENLLKRGLKLEDVGRITILTTSNAAQLTGQLPTGPKLGYIDRQFSMQYLAAAAFEGRRIADVVFTATEEEDRRWMSFAHEKISVARLDDLMKSGQRSSAVVMAVLKDGTLEESGVPHPLGDEVSPMSLNDIRYKFKEIALKTIGPSYELWEKEGLELKWSKLAQRVYQYLSVL